MSPRSCASWTCGTVSRRWCWPTSPASSALVRNDARQLAAEPDGHPARAGRGGRRAGRVVRAAGVRAGSDQPSGAAGGRRGRRRGAAAVPAEVPDEHAARAGGGVGIGVREVTEAGYYAAWHFYSTLILVHTVASAAELRTRRGLAGLGCVLLAYGYLQTFQHNDVAEVLISAIFVGVAYASGILLRRQIDQTLRLARQATRLEVEREERARQAVAGERVRIARELHDIVSHNVSLMTLHTGGVRMMLRDDPDRERERTLLTGVERAGREAIEELRLMLGMLRSPGGTAAEPHATGLDRLDALVAQIHEAGPAVEVRVEGEARPVPPQGWTCRRTG
ncbi:sensor histidine kinase [Nonomuraea ferruginea]